MQKTLVITLEEFEYLHARIRDLEGAIRSHLAEPNRDGNVMNIVSGSGSVWLCVAELEDLRETVKALSDVVETYESRLKELEPGPGGFTWKRGRTKTYPGDKGWSQGVLGL